MINPFRTKKVGTVGDYSSSGGVAQDAVINGEYNAPSAASPITPAGNGWAPATSQPSTVGYPSAQRLGITPLSEMHARGGPSDREYVQRDADTDKRDSAVSVQATGWHERVGVGSTDQRWADRPGRTPPPPDRITSDLAPTTYSFTRPFDVSSARQLTGQHFSMADHRRNRPQMTGGMIPNRKLGRNTYRLEPEVYGSDIVDLPPDYSNVEARLPGVEIPYSPASRSNRLM